MNAFPPLGWISGTANRDENATKRRPDVVDESALMSRPFYKKTRFNPPWSLPSIQRFNSPERTTLEQGLFAHEIKWDDKTTGLDTLDVLCDTHFFGHNIGKSLIRGEFMLLYTGPINLKQTIINAKFQRDRRLLPLDQTDSRRSVMKKVIPLNKLAQMINDTVKFQRQYFGTDGGGGVSVDDLDFENYVQEMMRHSDLGSILSLVTRMRTPHDFWSYFKPLGFLHSIDGKTNYDGSSCPLISVQNRGLGYTTHLPGGKFAPVGTRLFYGVGMTNVFRRTERIVENAVLNYPRPCLVYAAEDSPKNLVRQCGFVNASRENCSTSSIFKYVGNFVSSYKAAPEKCTSPCPYVQIDMTRQPFRVYA